MTTLTIKDIVKADKLDKLIEGIAKTSRKLDADMHLAAVSALVHADEHGDIRPMNALFDAMPKGMRKNALLEWCERFGKFKAAETGKQVVFDKFAKSNVEGALAKEFWEIAPEAKYTAFDLRSELERLIKKATKANESDKNLSKVDMLDVAVLEAALDNIKPVVLVEAPALPVASNDDAQEVDPLAELVG